MKNLKAKNSFQNVFDYVKNSSKCDLDKMGEKEKKKKYFYDNTFILLVACFAGLHIFTKDKNDVFIESTLRIVYLLFGIMSQIAVILLSTCTLATNSDFWFNILLVPYMCALGYTCSCLIFIFMKRRQLKELLNSIKNLELHSDRQFNILSVLAFATSIFTCVFFFVDEDCWEVYRLALITYTLIVPNIFDLYVLLLLYPISDAISKYGRKIKDTEIDSEEIIHKFAHEWLSLKKNIMNFETIFGKAFTCRILLFVVQLMCLIYVLTSMKWSFGCMMPIAPILLTTYDLVSKFFLVTAFGSKLISKNESIANTLSEKRFLDIFNAANDSISTLLMVTESQPCVIKMWGIGTLEASVFIQGVGIILTYVVVLIQLQPEKNYYDLPKGFENATFSHFAHCVPIPADE